MKIVVCKASSRSYQRPADPKTGTLIREGVKSILNPFCEYALDHAVRIKHSVPVSDHGGHNGSASPGRPTRSFELGADEAS